MNANILCTLLAQRTPPEQFQVWGTEVHWMSPEYDTPENQAIVADVIANYDTLAAEYEVSQIVIKKRQAYKNEADPLYLEWQALSGREHADAAVRKTEWEAKVVEIEARFNNT